MSGGVDSSVAALLLRDAGHQVHGVTMKIYSGKPAEGPVADSCYGPGEQSDIEEAARICARLGIPHTVVDLCDEYRSLVLDYARDEYLSGRTPNPCVLCNGRVKFGLLLDRLANTEGVAFDLFATGHYCRIAEVPGRESPGRANPPFRVGAAAGHPCRGGSPQGPVLLSLHADPGAALAASRSPSAG